jgi:hypothetical protein
MFGNIGADLALEMDDTDFLTNPNNTNPPGLPVSGIDSSVADANLQEGADPNNDPDLPFVGGATYKDWEDVGIQDIFTVPFGSVEDHRILDWTANDDETMFRPQSDSCVNDGSVVPKQDFTQSYIANNNDYLYFAQERRTNNGNSVYYWLLTHLAPRVVFNDDCSAAQTKGQLQFTLSTGDLEVVLNFPDSSNPAAGSVFLREFVGGPTGWLEARDAVFDAGWVTQSSPDPIENFAVNINVSGGMETDDIIGSWGGLSAQGNKIAQGTNEFDTAQLAEWAINLGQVFDGAAICGQRLFLTGISRASTGQVDNPTEPSAIKDLVGPKLYSFGQIDAALQISPICEAGVVTLSNDYKFTYSATATGIGGDSLPPEDVMCDVSCQSTAPCMDPNLAPDDATGCTGTGTIPRMDGAPAAAKCEVTCSATVSQQSTSCSTDASDTDDIYAPILAELTRGNLPSCTVPDAGIFTSSPGNIGEGVPYTASATGGDLNYSYGWELFGPFEPANACQDTSVNTCTVDIPDGAFCARAGVKVTVTDGSTSNCPGFTSDTKEVTRETLMSGTP